MFRFKIIFTKRKGFNILDRIIRLVLGTKYSHVLLEINFKNIERTLYFHASAFGVETLNSLDMLEKYDIVYRREIEVVQERGLAVKQFCVDNLHKGYGWLTFISIGAKKLFRALTPYGRDSDRSFICSEFVGHALAIALPSLLNNFELKSDLMSPKELYKIVRSI